MKFIVFYRGPVTQPDASHQGWMTWFKDLGNALVDRGSPLADGKIVRTDGSVVSNNSPSVINGYSIIEAKDTATALELVKTHPYLSLGDEYVVEIYTRG